MAGHSKWKNIQHRKGAQDAKKGKVFSKILKEISVAVKTGGIDADANSRLRSALISARIANMPKDNIERAIKKASGGEDANLLELTYEGYGLGGVGIFIECMTDNGTRTVGNIRSYFSKYGGSLGKDGCLQFIFSRKGVFTIPLDPKLDEDEFTLMMIDSGAEDVEFDQEEKEITITTTLEGYSSIQKKLEELKISPKEAGLQRIPLDTKSIDKETFQTVMKLIDKLEDDDDVQKVYHNIEFSDELANEF